MPSMFYDYGQKQTQSIKQLQRLIMSKQMQQAIHILQLPSVELMSVIENELEQNPVLEFLEIDSETDSLEKDESEEKELEFSDQDFEVLKRLDEDFKDHFDQTESFNLQRTEEEKKQKVFQEQSIQSQETLYEHLEKQAQETFDNQEDLEIAYEIIGSFDERGFLDSPLEEIGILKNVSVSKVESVLKKIQTFDPSGVGAKNIQESLLIQLRRQNKKESLAYRIIELHFDDLLHNRIPLIKKSLKCSVENITKSIDQELVHLYTQPGTLYTQSTVQVIRPDVVIREDDATLDVEVPDSDIPPLRLNSKYLKLLEDETVPLETKDYIRNKIMSARWLMKNINQRSDTLERLARFLLDYQSDFFAKQRGTLEPLTMKVVAQSLELHESTIARAVAHKYIETPRGVFPLRYFFTTGIASDQGHEISSRTVHDILENLIENEDKKHPLSDQKLSDLLEKKGVRCARRTVAKYREELKIGNTQQRRHY